MYKPHINTLRIQRQIAGEWKVGDWCVNEYKIKMITEIKDNIVRSVSDGYFSLYYINLNDDIFPLTINTKRLAEFIDSEYGRLQKWDSLNFPDLHRKYCEFFKYGCDLCFRDYENELDFNNTIKKFFESVEKFTANVLNTVEQSNKKEIDGVRIFR